MCMSLSVKNEQDCGASLRSLLFRLEHGDGVPDFMKPDIHPNAEPVVENSSNATSSCIMTVTTAQLRWAR